MCTHSCDGGGDGNFGVYFNLFVCIVLFVDQKTFFSQLSAFVFFFEGLSFGSTYGPFAAKRDFSQGRLLFFFSFDFYNMRVGVKQMQKVRELAQCSQPAQVQARLFKHGLPLSRHGNGISLSRHGSFSNMTNGVHGQRLDFIHGPALQTCLPVIQSSEILRKLHPDVSRKHRTDFFEPRSAAQQGNMRLEKSSDPLGLSIR